LQLNATWKYQQKNKILTIQEKELTPSKWYVDNRVLETVKLN